MKTPTEMLDELQKTVHRVRDTPVVDNDFPSVLQGMFSAAAEAYRLLGEIKNIEETTDISSCALPKPSFLEELRHSNIRRCVEWQGEPESYLGWAEMSFRASELGEEAGEVQGVIKKFVRHLRGMKGGIPLELTRTRLKAEIGDVQITLDRVAEAFDINIETATRSKFNADSKRRGFKERL